jgi:hypothetical protein
MTKIVYCKKLYYLPYKIISYFNRKMMKLEQYLIRKIYYNE